MSPQDPQCLSAELLPFFSRGVKAGGFCWDSLRAPQAPARDVGVGSTPSPDPSRWPAGHWAHILSASHRGTEGGAPGPPVLTPPPHSL